MTSVVTQIRSQGQKEMKEECASAHRLLDKKLRAVVLLGGAVRPTELSRVVGRSVLDLPLSKSESILDCWHRQAEGLAVSIGIASLSVRVMINRGSEAPRVNAAKNHVIIGVEEDASEYRGTAGVVRDLAEDYKDDDLLLVVTGAQVVLKPLLQQAESLAVNNSDVALVSHDDGTPSGIMLLRCAVLRCVPKIGYIDMKEQALPTIARKHRVTVMHQKVPSGLPVRTRAEYIKAVRQYHHQNASDKHVVPYGEAWQPAFKIIEDGATIGRDTQVYDSVVLSGANVERGAILVQSVVCPHGAVRRHQMVTDRVVT